MHMITTTSVCPLSDGLSGPSTSALIAVPGPTHRGQDANQRQGTYPSAFVGQLLFLAHTRTCFYQFLDNNLY
jgi:hypothetical protein